MDLLNNLAVGFATALSLQNLLYCFLGVTLGTLIGVLPGLGPVATLAMLLPITYTLDPTSALIMLAGIYYGSQYGGSTTAILVNLPGESASVVTCLDGYQMARQGKAGTALGIAAIGSFIAGCFATILVAAFAPPLIELAFKFGPAEYFSLMVLGLVGAVVLANGSVLKAFAMIILGLLLGIIGADVNSGTFRFDFGIAELQDGIDFVAISMGLFGFTEIIVNLSKGAIPLQKKSVLFGRAAKSYARPRRPLPAVPCWAPSLVFFPAAVPCLPLLLPTRLRKKSAAAMLILRLVKEILPVSPVLNPPTMPELRRVSFRCSHSVFPATPRWR